MQKKRSRTKFLPLLAILTIPAFAHDNSVAADVSTSEPCGQTNLVKFQKVIFDRTSEAEQLWSLIAVLLCTAGDDKTRAQKVYDYLPPSLLHRTEDLGMEHTSQTVDGSEELAIDIALSSQVDYAELFVKRNTLVQLEYSGGACSRRIAVSRQSGKWLIDTYVSGCD